MDFLGRSGIRYPQKRMMLFHPVQVDEAGLTVYDHAQVARLDGWMVEVVFGVVFGGSDEVEGSGSVFLFACEQVEVFSVFRYLRVSKDLLG